MESKTARTSALLNMLDTKYIRLSGESLDWRSAMELAAADLIRDGFFGTAYVEKAIENVEEYGSYIIISQGIALAHANRESGVYKDGLGLLISRDGIRFEDGEVVYMLFFFSTKGTNDYLQLFKEIIKLGNQSGNMQKMRRTKTPETAYRLMMEILTDYQDAEEKGRIGNPARFLIWTGCCLTRRGFTGGPGWKWPRNSDNTPAPPWRKPSAAPAVII